MSKTLPTKIENMTFYQRWDHPTWASGVKNGQADVHVDQLPFGNVWIPSKRYSKWSPLALQPPACLGLAVSAISPLLSPWQPSSAHQAYHLHQSVSWEESIEPKQELQGCGKEDALNAAICWTSVPIPITSTEQVESSSLLLSSFLKKKTITSYNSKSKWIKKETHSSIMPMHLSSHPKIFLPQKPWPQYYLGQWDQTMSVILSSYSLCNISASTMH